MRWVSSLALLAALATPGWKVYSLNASVDFLRDIPGAVPFFAYYRYGMMTDSVVFNINSRDCPSVVDDVIPAFRQFVAVMELHEPDEIRLAWQGETVAVVHRTAMETIWHNTAWSGEHGLDPLSQAVHCSSEDELLIDWIVLTPGSSALT